MKPLITPIATARPSEAAIASGVEKPSCINCKVRALLTAIEDMSERSSPRPITTMLMAMARMPSIETLRAIATRLPRVANPGRPTVKTTASTSVTSSTINSWESQEFRRREAIGVIWVVAMSG